MVIPPLPIARASVAAQIRRARSFNSGARALYFLLRPSVSTEVSYTRLGYSSSYFLTDPKGGAELLKQPYRTGHFGPQAVLQAVQELDRRRQQLDFVAHAGIYHA